MPDRQDLGRIWLQSCFVWLARVFAQNRNLMTLNKAGFLPFSRSPSVFLSSLHTTGSNHTLMLFLWIWAYDLQHSTSTFLKGEKTPPQATVAVPGRRTGPAILIIHSRSSFRACTLFIISPMWMIPQSVYSSFPLNFSSTQLSPVLNLGLLLDVQNSIMKLASPTMFPISVKGPTLLYCELLEGKATTCNSCTRDPTLVIVGATFLFCFVCVLLLI